MERLFQRYLGQVPTKYYLELRLQRARELLNQTSLSVTEIAVICGFLSPPHFSKCYRSVFGLSPSSERRQHLSPA
jgi:transcriptional regulator GlxA family with amidase domain